MQDVFWGNKETNTKLCSGNLVLVVIAMCSNAILSVFLPFFSSHPSAEVAPLAHVGDLQAFFADGSCVAVCSSASMGCLQCVSWERFAIGPLLPH